MQISKFSEAHVAATEVAGPSETKNKKLSEALVEFEALFASSLLRSARESSGSGWLGAEGGAGGDAITEFAEQHIARSMAQKGGLGIAKLLEGRLGRA
jgi:Rod binding domain-containing protein